MKKYNSDGTLLIVVSYKAGKEVKYDGVEADLDE
jgi:hypothetical protein